MVRSWTFLLLTVCASLAPGQDLEIFRGLPPEDSYGAEVERLDRRLQEDRQEVTHQTLSTAGLYDADSLPAFDDAGSDAPLPPDRADPARMSGPSSAADNDLADLKKQFQEFKDVQAKVKYPTVEVHGVFQADSGWFHQDQQSLRTVGDIQDGAGFRRARLSANGAVVENMNYFMQMDFAFFGRPTFTDVWVEATKVPILGNVRVGQWKQPFSLEVVSSFRYTMFAERSLLFQSFAPFRHIAVGFYNHAADERMTWAASVYRPGQDQYGNSISDNGGYATASRITWLPYYDEGCEGRNYLHLGLGNNFVAPKDRTARFRTIPEYFVGEQVGAAPVGTSGQAVPGPLNGVPFFVDTGSFGVNNYFLTGTELLWVQGPLTVQSEFNYLSAKRTNDLWARFGGLYVETAYFLTGEHRPYNRKQGAIDRIKPHRNFLVAGDDCAVGLGAWEVAARYSHLNLNDDGIHGGTISDWTAGLNWYMNPYAKLQVNYIRSFLINPALGHSHTDIYALRAQVDF